MREEEIKRRDKGKRREKWEVVVGGGGKWEAVAGGGRKVRGGGGGGESERLKAKKGRAEKTREGEKDGLERKLKKMES